MVNINLEASMSVIQEYEYLHNSAATMLDTIAMTATDHSDARGEAPLVVLVAVATAKLDVGVTSPSAVATPPRSVLARAQILCMPSRTDGRFFASESRNDVWLVWMKLFETEW